MPNQRQVQELLDGVDFIGERPLFAHEQEAIESLLGHPGLPVLLGTLLGTRQGCYVQIAAMPLVSEASRYQAAVLQGTIKGIDLVSQSLLQLFPAAGDSAKS